MKSCFIIFVLYLFFSCISFAQTSNSNIDPFLGHHTLGGHADLVLFNAHPDSGYEIGYTTFSNDSASHPVMFSESNNHIISCDGVSGNFLMGPVSDEARDEFVCGTMEDVGDSETIVKLYVGQWLNGKFSVVPYTIDSLKKQSNSSSNRNLIRMTSGYFDGGPAKEFAIAYNLPDSVQMITIRVFKLDGITYRPVEITSKQEVQFSTTTLGPQALFDIAAGNFEGNGLDEIVLVNNNALTTRSGSTGIVSLRVRAYDFNWTSKQLVKKGDDPNVSLNVVGSAISTYPLIQLVLTSGDFNGNGQSECVCGFSIYWYQSYVIDYYVKPFSLSTDLMNFDFNNNGGIKSTTQVEAMDESHANVEYFTNTSMSLVNSDLDLDGKDELIEADKWYLHIFNLDSTLTLSLLQNFPCYSKTQYLSHRRIAIGDIDGDTTFADSAHSKWYPEMVTSEFSVDPRNPTFSADNYNHIKVYKDTGSVYQVSDLVENYSGALNPSTQIANGGILTAYLHGNKITMGEPKLQVVKNLVEPVVILNAPPVGFDVIGDSTYNLCNAYPIGPTNSSSDPFSSQLVQINSTDADLTNSTKSSWGVSSTLSAGGSFLGIGMKASFTANYGHNFSKTQSNTSTFSVTYSKEAQWDDFILATVTNYDTWEYPVYADGVMKGHVIAAIAHPQGSAGFYNNDESGYGNNIILNHEPGNLLSYPDYSNPAQNPDVGSIIYVGALTSIGASNSPGFLKLDFGTINSSNVQMSSNYGFSAKASVEGWGVSLETEANYNHDAVNTHTTTISKSFELTANAGSINSLYSSAGYTITPYIYWSKEGALVLDYLVGFPSGATFWKEHYSQYPDLTFNCYYRYFKQKGLSGLSPEISDWTKEIQIFPSIPKEGDTVTVLAEIHNYSLKTDTSQVQVRFYLGSSENGGIPVLDLHGDSVFTTSSPVTARGDQIINFKWKVPSGLVSSDSVIYAVIDPDNKIPELKKDNNVGWNRISILDVTAVSPAVSTISSFELSQNYPNPFNPVTRINYQIPKFSHVTIKVYNILGQEIATLVNGERNAGQYSVEFNASRFASGIYFYRMQAGSFVSTKKLILLK